MKLWVTTLLVALGVIASPLAQAFAEENRKSMKEVLVEKGVLTRDEAAGIQETVLSKWIDRITFTGDLRVRHESIFSSGAASTIDRHRERVRLRLGTEIRIKDVTVIIRLASGDGNITSTNQSFDNLFAQKPIWIDRAYVSWQDSHTPWLKLSSGKMANPFFTAFTSDIVWDEDVTPEGFAENFKLKAAENVAVFVNLGQFVLDEDAADNHDQWLFGQQAGISVEPQTNLKATLAAAYYAFVGARNSTLGQPAAAIQSGNTRTAGGVLINNYNVLDVTLVLNGQAGPLPLALMGDYIRNLSDTTNGAGVATGNEGYQLAAIVGKASDAHTWEVAYYYKVAQTDATLADISDSEFGNGGINRRGHGVWAAYNLTQYLQFKTRYSITKSIAGPENDINRFQADVSVKF